LSCREFNPFVVIGRGDLCVRPADDSCSFSKEYQTMPHMAVRIPTSFFKGISSPKSKQPPVKIMTVFMWPMTL